MAFKEIRKQYKRCENIYSSEKKKTWDESLVLKIKVIIYFKIATENLAYSVYQLIQTLYLLRYSHEYFLLS